MKRTIRILSAATLLALASLASAQTVTTAPKNTDIDTQVQLLDATAANKGQTQVAARIAAYFANLAGSKDNALALVNALRTGTDVNLVTTTTVPGTGGAPPTTTTTTTTFTPPTSKMGWGNVKIALGLAQDALLRAGITKPTAEQLQIALLGGDIKTAAGTTVTLKGVLQMRADGMGWGQIAHAGGTNVGPVVSSLKATQARLAALPATDAAGTKTSSMAASAATKGIVSAGGSSASMGKGPSKGLTTASGASSSASGLVTADGAGAGSHAKGNAYGRGIVTGAGSSAGAGVAATSGGKPAAAGAAGIVTASGGSAAASVSTANGNSADHGKALGKGKAGG